jgi:hypothetical protein
LRDQAEVRLRPRDGGIDVENDELIRLLLVEDLDRIDGIADVFGIL